MPSQKWHHHEMTCHVGYGCGLYCSQSIPSGDDKTAWKYLCQSLSSLSVYTLTHLIIIMTLLGKYYFSLNFSVKEPES
jgi:hypothetical protein